MPLIAGTLGLIDRPHIPAPGDPRAATYKEWWHFNLLDDASGLDLIVNLSLSGDIRTARAGEANLILLAYQPSQGWTGGVTQHDGLAARVAEDTVDIALEAVSVRYNHDHYRVQARDPGGEGIELDLVLVPQTEPMVVWKNTPLGSGHINWAIVPYLTVEGSVRVGQRRYRLAGARGYHDHNWGHWRWGENFGWDWGFCSAFAEVAGLPMSFVYDRTVDRTGNRVMEHSLALWHGETLLKFFPRQQVRMRRRGHYRGPIRRSPGVGALIDPAHVGTVPGRVEIEAADGEEWVEARYIPDAALQIAIPRETGFGIVELNETLGWLTISGELGGMAFTATRRACFEFVG